MKKRKNFIIKSFCVMLTLIAFFGSIFCIQKIDPIKANANSIYNDKLPDTNLFYVTWSDPINWLGTSGYEVQTFFVSNNENFNNVRIYGDIETFPQNFSIYYDNLLVNFNGQWIEQNYRVMGFENETIFNNSTLDIFVGGGLQLGYNIQINYKGWYTFINTELDISMLPNQTGITNNINMQFYTIQAIKMIGEENYRSYFNNLSVMRYFLDYEFIDSNNEITFTYPIIYEGKWTDTYTSSQEMLSSIYIENMSISYNEYIFFYNNGVFDKLKTPNNELSNLVFSVISAPFTLFSNFFNFELLGITLITALLGIISLGVIIKIIKWVL